MAPARGPTPCPQPPQRRRPRPAMAGPLPLRRSGGPDPAVRRRRSSAQGREQPAGCRGGSARTQTWSGGAARGRWGVVGAAANQRGARARPGPGAVERDGREAASVRKGRAGSPSDRRPSRRWEPPSLQRRSLTSPHSAASRPSNRWDSFTTAPHSAGTPPQSCPPHRPSHTCPSPRWAPQSPTALGPPQNCPPHSAGTPSLVSPQPRLEMPKGGAETPKPASPHVGIRLRGKGKR
ncbi:proline-rich protein 36-like [Pyrgilauda ruficollis]|uniref:proline-rich protein 36-like n=1 Tax=Pyrgilauda ruficollis TaxID=221976 RepID=UPI001B8872DB|nr:proline-rich protein 36-like [Pyrgilauda ruficollis]